MLEAFQTNDIKYLELGYATILVRLMMAVFSGLFIAFVYRVSHGREKRVDNHAMFTTLVLLCIFIAMVSLVIGNSVAMAFSLVGALSIVRFRTVVDDTRDTAFVIFSVITGMAMGSGFFAVPALGLPIASIAAIALHHWGFGRQMNSNGLPLNPWMLLAVRIGIGKDPKSVFARLQEKFLDCNLLSTSTTKQGSAIEMIARVQLKPDVDPVDFVATSNLIDGIQSVELKSLSKLSSEVL